MSSDHVLPGVQSRGLKPNIEWFYFPLVHILMGQGGISLQPSLPIFYSALLLTLVNLLLRFIGTSFQVYVSGQIGAAGIGLLQLVMSVNSLALVAGTAGIRTAAMYLTAEELGKEKLRNVTWVLSGCFAYSILFSSFVAAVLYFFAPQIASLWIENPKTAEALRLFSVFLPVICMCGVMTGYFTAANRIGSLAAVEVIEQLFSMGITVLALTFWAGRDPVKACQSVILGSCGAACLTLLCLTVMRLLERPSPGNPIPVASRLLNTALPLAAADILKSGINTAENLMVPGRLAMNPLVADPLAAFGIVSGMVFPVLMFPACILFGLAELLIPELARCAAGQKHRRISYLVQKSLRIAMLYGLAFGGLEFLLADWLGMRLYSDPEAGRQLRLYAVLIPMLYCDAITDAMTKGLGQQKACVRYNILTSGMDVLFLYLLLPKYGMTGYFVSFAVTHVLNFLLSLRRLLKITGERIHFHIPAFSLSAAIAAVLGAGFFQVPTAAIIAFLLLFGSLLCLFQVTGKDDLLWLKGLIRKK